VFKRLSQFSIQTSGDLGIHKNPPGIVKKNIKKLKN
jgi:hypothetical protein